MHKKLLAFYFLSSIAFAYSQHSYVLDVVWDGFSTNLNISQEVAWTNTSNVGVNKVVLLDWNHAYASERSPLGKFLATEYDYKLIRTSKQKGGFTTIATIRNQNETLSWMRKESAIDIVEVTLPKTIAPNAHFVFTVHYTVQLPNAAVFKYGASNNELHAQHWHLVLAMQNQDGTWKKESNLGFGRPKSENTKTSYRFDVPDSVRVLLPANKNQPQSPLLLTRKDTYKRIPFGKSELISDMLPINGATDFKYKLSRISTFIEHTFPNDKPQVFWALQKDYAQKPLLSLESIPQFLGAFDKNQVVELKLLKAILEQCVQNRYSNLNKNTTWISDGLPYYLWQQYVSSNYPNLRMTGSLNSWPVIKNYHFTQAPYYRSWEIAANVSGNKNRGQSLVTPKDKLTRYNRRLANPYRAALALLYLDAYVGETTVLNAVKALPKNKPIDTFLRKEIADKTDKPIDWFFEHYIRQNNNGDLSISAKKIDDQQYKITVSNTKEDAAIPLTIRQQNGVQSTAWIPNDRLPYTQTYDRNSTQSLTVNKNHFIPELSLNNNSYDLNKKVFRNNLRFRLFQDIPQSGTSVLLLSPEFGYNVYDGFLTGLTIGNSSMLSNNFRFKISPQIGTKSTQANGMGYMIGSLYHDNKSHYLTRLTLFGSSYNYALDKRYSTFTPSVQLYFRPNGIQQKDRSYLLFHHVSVHLQDLPEDDPRRSYGVTLATFSAKKGNALQNIAYKTELQWASVFKKLSAEIEYITYYLPNRRLVIRTFVGGFLQNNSSDSYFDYNTSRVNDYLFQYDLYGRSESEGFFSQQYIKAEGALRTAGSVSGANKWMISAQTSTTLWRWIEGYAEIGWIKNKEQKAHTHWGTGVTFNLIPDFFEVHFPLYDATGNLATKSGYTKQIRFQLSLRPATLVQLFSRSWF